jgi:DUF971 family protein
MNVYPTKLERRGANQLLIEWSDGEQRLYSAGELRDACPCATCREKSEKPAPAATMLPVIPLSEAQPLSILGMQPVGNYAYSIAFSDGHDTGIYSFELLRGAGKVAS